MTWLRLTNVLAIFVLASASAAETLIIYPAKGQSSEQQSKDEVECQQWAKKTTGVDPLALASAASQPAPVSAAPAAPPPQKGQRVRGAARGAAAGAVIGEIADDDAGKGAAVGAAAGAVAGGSRKRRQERQAAASNQQAQAQAEQQAQTQSANTQAQLATFNKAYAACLEGRGYTVK